MKTSSLIEDPELMAVAEKYGLDEWEWGVDSEGAKVLMMEGAALCLSEFHKEAFLCFRICSSDYWINEHEEGVDIDPLTVDFIINDDTPKPPRASISLSEQVREYLDAHDMNSEYPWNLKAVADGFKTLADEIYATISSVDEREG